MGFPSFPKGFESAITIGWAEIHREYIAQLAIKVSRFRLGPLKDTDHDVTQRRESFGDNPQRYRLAGSRLAGDQGETAFLHQLFDAPRKTFDTSGYQQAFTGEFWRKGGSISVPTAREVSWHSSFFSFLGVRFLR